MKVAACAAGSGGSQNALSRGPTEALLAQTCQEATAAAREPPACLWRVCYASPHWGVAHMPDSVVASGVAEEVL